MHMRCWHVCVPERVHGRWRGRRCVVSGDADAAVLTRAAVRVHGCASERAPL